jgi:hypothetical protein
MAEKIQKRIQEEPREHLNQNDYGIYAGSLGADNNTVNRVFVEET